MATKQKDYFNSMASKHGSTAVLVPGASVFRNSLIDKSMRKALSPVMTELHDQFILEIGCGVGRWIQITSKRNHVLGVDLSRSMIKIAKENCKKNCFFIIADASFLPFKDNTFDLTITITILQHILNDRKFSMALSEVARCSSSEVLIMEEMWSDKIILLEQAYCPIRIVPADRYTKGLMKSGLKIESVGGITFAPMALLFARTMGGGPVQNRTAIANVKEVPIVSSMAHLIMAIGVIPAVLFKGNKFNSRLSMHTLVFARKTKLKTNHLQHLLPS